MRARGRVRVRVRGRVMEAERHPADDIVLVLFGEYLGQPEPRDATVDLVG